MSSYFDFSAHRRVFSVMKPAVLLLTLVTVALAQSTEIQDGMLARLTSDPAVIVRRTPLRYPKQAMAEAIQGTVTMKVAVDAAGRVRSATATGGPDALRPATLEAVNQWLFVPGAAEHQVSIEYRIPAKDAGEAADTFKVIADALSKAPKEPRRPLAGRAVTGIQFLGIPTDARPAVLERIAIKVGDTLSNEGMDRAQEELRKLDPKIQFKVLSVGDDKAQVILFRESGAHF